MGDGELVQLYRHSRTEYKAYVRLDAGAYMLSVRCSGWGTANWFNGLPFVNRRTSSTRRRDMQQAQQQ
eukprot:1613144-Rhodomonas_salina.1